ncbi:tRNA (adenine(22)-N(1))-methyltransferase [Effusibacillus consociatus]|uniref:tRNA (Adenine(22)-N(1))-methyltransferase n=1 Tax=Effusibacillus consociatus TaxID=1117041 RepID=A0ABV9Q2D0_9BACL
MIQLKLSKRLQQVASLVPNGATLADIGSDHAYLPAYLIEEGRIRFAIAGEVNQGPYETAKRTVEEAGCSERIRVRKGNGLEVLEAGEVNTVTICGMGGGTIVDILSRGKDKLTGVRQLVLQPMVDGDQLRRWLHANGWRIAKEELVVDEGILYEILKAEPGYERYHDDLWYEVGSVELLRHHPLFPDKLKAAIGKIDRVLKSLRKAQGEEALQKQEALVQKKKRLEEVLRLCKPQ